MPKMVFKYFLVVNSVVYFGASATVVRKVTSAAFDGVGFYISVNRSVIQKKLDSFHMSVPDECGEAPKLFLPGREVFPDLHDHDQHPVYLDVGFLTSHDFDQYLAGNPSPCVVVSGLEVAVTVPFLADNSSGAPVYALALAKFYEKSRGNFPKNNFLYPYIPVDKIEMNNFGAVVRNGSEEMKFSFNRLNHPCKPPNSIVSKEFEGFILNQLGRPEHDFSFCDSNSFESNYCDSAANVSCSAHRYAPNLCQLWKSTDHVQCVTSVEFQNITSGFRKLILLGEDPINVLASESFSGDYTIGINVFITR